ncbi:thioredoxin-dependent thiol peroxidase [candidate division FCPU426 bacterium]|nr:thioredoxin-dependent thiol peroxidase [candidate division FCPU426 bacterium]
MGFTSKSFAAEPTPRDPSERALTAGDPAPDFALPDAQGRAVKLADFRGKHVILYFYPKDNTPGCTQQACDFRDQGKNFQELEAVIIGISRDSSQSHAGFAAKHGLPFLLLADTEGKVVRAYGVWKPNFLLGAVGLGIERTTFLIDPEGKIARVYPKVKVAGHVEQVLEDLRAMGTLPK